MICGRSTLLSGLGLLLLYAAATGCSPAAETPDVESELAEQEELLEAAEEHAGGQEGTNSDAMGAPINVPTTIPPPAADAAQDHGHDGHSSSQAASNSL